MLEVGPGRGTRPGSPATISDDRRQRPGWRQRAHTEVCVTRVRRSKSLGSARCPLGAGTAGWPCPESVFATDLDPFTRSAGFAHPAAMTDTNFGTGTLVGYARVSTTDQHTDLQLAALSEAGVTRIFEEKASGTRTDRPQLAAALDYLRSGDTLVVWRLDRLGRSLRHLIETVTDLEARGVGFRSLNDHIDTTTPTGRLVFHVLASLAQFERDLTVERTKAGLAAARERGAKPGRKPSLTPEQVDMVNTLHAGGQHTVTAIADAVGASRATVYRALRQTA